MIFSDRISSLQPSAIREILKVTQDPEVISFAAGNPDPASFPAEDMAEIAAKIFKEKSGAALQYGVSEGYTPLRLLTRERIQSKYNIGKDFDDLIITSGGQQVVEITAKILSNEGDSVICETPSFIGALNAFRSYNVNLAGVRMDNEGMDLDALEDALKSSPRVKLIYTIPTFQNPAGVTMSLKRRERILELAEKYDVFILEDNPYFELRFRGDYVPPIKSLDNSGRVIYAGSYSKVLAPGIRLGYVCAHRDIVSKMTVAKQVSDVHTNLFFMMLAAEYLKTRDIDAHISKIRELYHVKSDLMCSEMDDKFNSKVKFNRPEGGLFVWCSLPDGYDGMEFCRVCGESKVAAVPGSAFSVDEKLIVPTFRLNYSLPTEEQIKTGIARMAKALNEYVK